MEENFLSSSDNYKLPKELKTRGPVLPPRSSRKLHEIMDKEQANYEVHRSAQ